MRAAVEEHSRAERPGTARRPSRFETRRPRPPENTIPRAVDAAARDVDARDVRERSDSVWTFESTSESALNVSACAAAAALREPPGGVRAGARQGVAGGRIAGVVSAGVRPWSRARRVSRRADAVDLSGGPGADQQQRGGAREAAGHAPPLEDDSCEEPDADRRRALGLVGPPRRCTRCRRCPRCTQGYPSTNSFRNHAGDRPRARPPEFLEVRNVGLSRSRYSSHSGRGQQRSPARSPASRTSASKPRRFPSRRLPPGRGRPPGARGACRCRSRPPLEAPDVPTARRTGSGRPSASVLMISIVLPKWLFHDIARFDGVAGGEFSVAGMSQRHSASA